MKMEFCVSVNNEKGIEKGSKQIKTNRNIL